MSLPADDLNTAAHTGSHRPHFDGTINIPTILMLLAMIFGAVASGLGIYSTLSDRISANHSDIVLINSRAADAAASRDRERADVKDKLDGIGSKLDQLLWDRGNRTRSAERIP